MLCGSVTNNIWSNLYHLFHIYIYIYIHIYVRYYIYIYMLVTRNVWLFWREWAHMWKRCKEETLFSPIKHTVYFKRRKVKRYLKIAGAKEKPTRAQHLSTFPTPRVRTAVNPTRTFECHITLLLYTVLSNLKCFLSSNAFPCTWY